MTRRVAKLFTLGQTVISLAGRDAGHRMIVVAAESDQYVFVADGIHHSITKPKRKKVKHLDADILVAADHTVAWKLKSGEQISDAELRNFMKTLEGEMNSPDGI